MTEKRKETPQARYDRENAVLVGVKLIKTTESDLVEWINSQPNKSGYIKSLIRADMEKHKQ